jgi:hypothetical protein
MATTYRDADIPERLAQPMIQNYHSHLADARIIWLFSTGTKSGASVCPGLLRHAFGRDASGITPDFVVIVAERDWQSRTPDARELFVDELLCSMGQETNQTSGADKYVINKPDVSLYLAAVKRHGLHTTEQRQVGRIILDLPQQLKLQIEDAALDTTDLDEDLAGEDDHSDWPEAPAVFGSSGNTEDGDTTKDLDWQDATRPDVSPEALSRIRGSVEAGAR